MQTERIILSGIEIGERLRPIDEAHVGALMASIKEIGLQTPITVMSVANGADYRMILVAGRHRLEALRRLGEDEVDCIVIDDDQDAADLWEIDENLARAELSDAQRADHHTRREAILIRRGEVRCQGRPEKGAKSASISYAQKTAADLGVSKRTVQQDLARGKKIAPEVLAEVAGSDLDKGVVLDDLARTPRDEQPARLAAIRQERAQVRPAPDPLDDHDAHEKQLAALMAAWNRAAAVVRQEFLLRIDEPVFDKGRAA